MDRVSARTGRVRYVPGPRGEDYKVRGYKVRGYKVRGYSVRG